MWAFMAGYRVNQIITTSSVLPWRNKLIASLFVADEALTLTRNMHFDTGAQNVQLQIVQRTASGQKCCWIYVQYLCCTAGNNRCHRLLLDRHIRATCHCRH
jgi:hypothetical protein